MMKKLLLFLFLISLSFASWHSIAGLAILASFSILAIIFAIGYGFGLEELKIVSKEEMFQLIVTVILVAILGSVELTMNSFSADLGSYVGESETIQALALEDVTNSIEHLTLVMTEVRDFSNTVGYQATVTFYCNLLGSGIFLSPCGAYNSLLPSLAVASQMLSVALAEFSSLQILTELGMRYAFNFILPLGIFLRTFKVTRGAGGFLIALGVCLYFVLPLSILFINSIIYEYMEDEGYLDGDGNPIIPHLEVENCDRKQATTQNINRVQTTISNFVRNTGNDHIENFTFYFLISATFLTVITLLIFLVSLRLFTSLGGAEIDVSALGRLA